MDTSLSAASIPLAPYPAPERASVLARGARATLHLQAGTELAPDRVSLRGSRTRPTERISFRKGTKNGAGA